MSGALLDALRARQLALARGVEDRLLTAFQRSAASVPAIKALLEEHAVRPEHIVDLDSFTRLVPLRTKANTFDRFTLDELSAGGRLPELADVLTSSGHGGRFSFGVKTREEAAQATTLLDDAFDAAFGVRRLKTLTINCLPMGVVFGSDVMTVATVSVREDMAVALLRAFGHRYDQVVLVLDPLFAKRLLAHAAAQGLDWRRLRVNAILGEEIFGERFRGYLSHALGLDPARPEGGYVCSSFGVGELGLHLCFETTATIAVRRALAADLALRRELLGPCDETAPVPMIMAFDPLRTHVEIVETAADGFGALVISMLNPTQVLPMFRYGTGDVAALLDADRVEAAMSARGVSLPGGLPRALLALRGRAKEALPNGAHVGLYKDALYADRSVADLVTGAVRLAFEGTACTMHVQLEGSSPVAADFDVRLRATLPAAAQPERIVTYPRAQFPFGMNLDYERKFAYYVATPGADHVA